jgi:hypothetical protein
LSLAPSFEFDVLAAKDGLESDRTKLTMKEGENKVITLMLKAKPPVESSGNPLEQLRGLSVQCGTHEPNGGFNGSRNC